MDVEGEVSAAAAATNGLGGDEASAPPARLSAELLDVEAYVAQYSGWTRLRRLIFIAQECGVESIELEALRMAHDEARNREDTLVYRDVAVRIDGRLGPGYDYDQVWVDSVNRRAEQRKEKLENELDGFRIHLIKESIRMGYNDIGDFYYGHGHLSEALESYICTRDYCTTSKHVVQMCMHVILVSVQLGQFAHVTNYVSKAEQTPDELDPIIVAKLRAAAGLAYLETKKYKLAARKFLETGPELGTSYSEVIAPQDVAVYGALCAVASFDRSDIEGKVMDNDNFCKFMELVPEVRELVNDFYSSRYGSCLEHLEKLKPNLLLDIHLHEHLETLYKEIFHKAIIEHTVPFISVDLNKMADAFKTSVSTLEKELAALISENKIKARIDFDNNILFRKGARWVYLIPTVQEMVRHLEESSRFLTQASQRLENMEAALDYVLDPNKLKVTAGKDGVFDLTTMRQYCVRSNATAFRNIIEQQFSPSSKNEPIMRRVISTISKLLEDRPLEIYGTSTYFNISTSNSSSVDELVTTTANDLEAVTALLESALLHMSQLFDNSLLKDDDFEQLQARNVDSAAVLATLSWNMCWAEQKLKEIIQRVEQKTEITKLFSFIAFQPSGTGE